MPFDVFFFSMREVYADSHWRRLQEICPRAKKVEGISPAVMAWKGAAADCSTSHFFSVDADNWVYEDFDFDAPVFDVDIHPRRVHIWRCANAINGLVYGHSAIKLWPKELLGDEAVPHLCDFTASLAEYGVVIQSRVASENRSNSSPFSAFAASYKECFKLNLDQTVFVGTQPDLRTAQRLRVWASLGRDVENGIYSILGARLAMLKSFSLKGQLPDLSRGELESYYGGSTLRVEFEKIEDPEGVAEQVREKLTGFGVVLEEVDAERSRELKGWLQPV